MRQQFANQDLVPLGSASSGEFGKFARADYDRVARLVRITGIKPEFGIENYLRNASLFLHRDATVGISDSRS
ncbi:MAG: hypothetical protein ACK4N4_03305 [Burkholderiales bacterium]